MEQSREIFVGRKKELNAILQALQSEKHVILLGEQGIGKTALANELMKRLFVSSPKRVVLYCPQSVSLKDTCVELLGSLWRLKCIKKRPVNLRPLSTELPWEKAKAHFQKLRVTVLKNLFLANIVGEKYFLVFDHLAKIKLKFFLFLDDLRDVAQLVLITRKRDKESAGRLWMLLWKYEKITIGPLSVDESKKLIAMTCRRPLANREYCEILRISRHNPGILARLCSRLSQQQPVAGSVKNVKMASLDQKIDEFMGMKN